MQDPAKSLVKPIAAVHGASGLVIQQLFRDLARCWSASARIAGAVEVSGVGADGSVRLRCIPDGPHYPLFQELGSGSTGCSLDPAGAVLAAERVCRTMADGCDLVLLSKYGKMEAEMGSGLLSAFVAAVEGGIPVLTSVAPRYADSWTRFADPFFLWLPPEQAAIERWWRSVRMPVDAPAQK